MKRNIVCLIVLFTAFVFVTSQTCPYGWGTKRFSETWPCYLMTNKIKRTWNDAQKFCKQMGGDLLVLKSSQERDWVFNVLKSYTGYYPTHTEWWIGLHDSNGAVQWADGTSLQANLIPWVAGEPGIYDHSKACVEYVNGSVGHQDCLTPQYFVCKRPRESAIWCDALHGWESINQMCYKIVTKLTSWDDGRAECQKENGDLVVVGDQETEMVLFNFVESRKANLWIGLRAYRNATTAYFAWETKDGSKLNTLLFYFNSQTPLQDVAVSNYNQSCVYANHSLDYPHLWQTGDCGERRFSLCQKPKERCSAGWIENAYTCYLFVARPKTNWMDAKDYCDQRGATLLHIQSPGDQNFINSNLGAFRSRGIGSIWLGLSVKNSSRGVWTDGGVFTPYSPYIYSNLNGQNLTNAQGLHCYTIYTDDVNGTWQVANDCMSNKSFVCQIQAQLVPKIPTTPAPTGSTVSPVSTIPTSPVTWSTDCGPFWIKDSKTGYCYKFSDNTMTWFEARHSCENEGAQLTSINTYHEELFITDFVYGFKSDALWIGVNNLNTHSGYNWIDGSGFGYINWAPGEPNNVHDNEHCAEFIVGGDRNGQWNDINCNERRGYICKKKSNDFSTLPPLTTPSLPAGKIFGCPDANWLGYGNNCFLFKTSNLSWTEASKYCEGQGYNLASIANQNEQNFVFSQIQPDKGYKNSDQYWIGLNDLDIQMIFKWTDGTPVGYTNWDDQEPNNFLDRREDCVTIYHWDGKWNDAPCYTSRIGFICKTPKAVLPSTAIQANLGQGCSIPGSIAYGYMCYLIKQTPQTWDDANLDCVAKQGTLATIHDRYQQAFLASQIAGTTGYYWIGMSDKAQLGLLQWIDGRTVDYTAWSGNHTGNAISTCISMRTGGPIVGLWVDQSCLIQQRYICQFPRAGYSTPLMTTTTTLTPPVCPSGWYDYNGYCYKVYTADSERQTWFGARDSCRAIGADLISLQSSDEQSKVFSYRSAGYRYGISYWIGLSDFGIEKQYQWTDGTAVDYTSWSPGEPNDNDGTDDCVELYSPGLKWNDNSCYVAKSYACKIKKGKTLQTTKPTQPTTAPVECAAFPGWKLLNGYCYFTSDNVGQNSRRTWYGARAYCNQQGAELASIHSEQENNNLVTLLSFTTKTDAWIGLKDVGQNQFKWSDGSLVDYTKWQGNEPNDAFGSEKCAQLLEYNAHWNDNDCNENYHFICKKKPGSSNPITPIPTSLIQGECPSGYTGVNSGNKCFKVFGARNTSARKEYTKARDACRSQGTNFDIASLNSHIELATVVSMLNGLVLDNSDLWIGLNDQNNNQRFTWQDSSQLLITNWDKGQPSSWGGKCVAMSSDSRHGGKWHNLRCSTVRPYVCEALRDPSIAPTQGLPTCQRPDYVSNGLDCYKMHNEQKTYSQATAACQGEQAYLTSIMSVYEQAYIDTLVGNINSPVWTGLRDPANTGTYSWADSSPVIYTNWNKGEPTYMPGEGCVSTNQGFWNDSMCHNLYPFVCKVLFFTPPPPTGYPSGYCKDVTWRQNDDFCYYFSFDRPGKTWSQADQDCVSRGMQLVSVTNRNEESFLLRELDQSSQASVDLWLGFKRLNGFFQWSDGTLQAAYINWESNPGSNDCVKLQAGNGKWKDANCENHNGYVCKTAKLPATSPTTPTTTIPTTSTTTVSTTSFTLLSSKVVSQVPGVSITSSVGTPSQSSKISSQQGNKKTSSVTMPSRQPTQTIPSNVKSPAKLQQQTTVVGSDLSAGQIAGIIVGVALVLVIACGILFFLKRRLSGTFNFSTLRNEGGFDNAAYDKQMQSVQINGKADKEQHVNGFSHGFTDSYDTDA